MAAWTYAVGDQQISTKPCLLYSLLVTTDGGGPGKVEVYDGVEAEPGHKVATILCDGGASFHTRWYGLKLTRGLYIEIVEKADYITVEWEPLPSDG